MLSLLLSASLTEASARGGRRFNTEENRHSGTDRCSRLPRQQLKAVLLLRRMREETHDQNIETSLSLCHPWEIIWFVRRKLSHRRVEIGLKCLSSTKTLSSSRRHRSRLLCSLHKQQQLSESRQRPFFLRALRSYAATFSRIMIESSFPQKLCLKTRPV